MCLSLQIERMTEAMIEITVRIHAGGAAHPTIKEIIATIPMIKSQMAMSIPNSMAKLV